MKYYLKLVATIALGVFLAWLGGLSRPYAAFGGEDVLAICITALAVHNYITDKRRENQE